MLFKELIRDIPDYKRFFTIDEMDERSNCLLYTSDAADIYSV